MNLSYFKNAFCFIPLALKRKRMPDKKRLVAALRGEDEIPRYARDFLADYLEGKVKNPRGRQPEILIIDNPQEYFKRSAAVSEVKEIAATEGISEENARHRVAKDWGYSYDTLLDEQYPDRRMKRRMVIKSEK